MSYIWLVHSVAGATTSIVVHVDFLSFGDIDLSDKNHLTLVVARETGIWLSVLVVGMSCCAAYKCSIYVRSLLLDHRIWGCMRLVTVFEL